MAPDGLKGARPAPFGFAIPRSRDLVGRRRKRIIVEPVQRQASRRRI